MNRCALLCAVVALGCSAKADSGTTGTTAGGTTASSLSVLDHSGQTLGSLVSVDEQSVRFLRDGYIYALNAATGDYAQSQGWLLFTEPNCTGNAYILPPYAGFQSVYVIQGRAYRIDGTGTQSINVASVYRTTLDTPAGLAWYCGPSGLLTGSLVTAYPTVPHTLPAKATGSVVIQ